MNHAISRNRGASDYLNERATNKNRKQKLENQKTKGHDEQEKKKNDKKPKKKQTQAGDDGFVLEISGLRRKCTCSTNEPKKMQALHQSTEPQGFCVLVFWTNQNVSEGGRNICARRHIDVVYVRNSN